MVYLLLIFALSVIICIFSGHLSNFVIPILFYSIGQVLTFTLSDQNNRKVYSRLYGTAYTVFMAYAVLCYIYMQEKGFSCLLVTDTITSYIPAVEDFMRLDSLKDGLALLYGDIDTSFYSHTGIILFYWTLVGKLAELCGYELYFNLQVSIFFLSAFVPVFLCKLLSQYDIKKPEKWSLLYVFCSVFFYYSTLILRDAPIALFYIIAFSYLFSKSSIKKHIVFIMMIGLSYFIRPQNGYFLLLFYYISFFSNSEKQKGSSYIVLALAAIGISYVSMRLDILDAFERNSLYLAENISQETEGFINALDRLPPIISLFSKAIYIHISPIPAWFYMGIRGVNESNNILGFFIYNFL